MAGLLEQDEKEGPCESFHNKGFLNLDLLSKCTCAKLRGYILHELESTLLANEEVHEKRFSNIRERNHRWDLKLPASPIVNQAMAEILLSGHDNGGDFMRSILAPLCQCDDDDPYDLILAELGTLVSEPGAKHQQWHADTAHTGPEEPDRICCFITLQDTPLSMGPTQLIPYTHEAEFHESAKCNFPPKGLMPTTVEPKSMLSGYRFAGEGLLMDCRLYHRGSANTHQPLPEEEEDESTSKRVIFYFTVRSRTARKPYGFLFTILEELNEMPLVDFLEIQETKQ